MTKIGAGEIDLDDYNFHSTSIIQSWDDCKKLADVDQSQDID